MNQLDKLEKSFQIILPRLTRICDQAVAQPGLKHVTSNMLKAVGYASTAGSTFFQCTGCGDSTKEIRKLYCHTGIDVGLINNMVTFTVNGIKRVVHFSVEPDNMTAVAEFDEHNRTIGLAALGAVRFGLFNISGKRFFRPISQPVRCSTFREFVADEAWQASWAACRLDELLEDVGKSDPLVAFSLWEDSQDQRVNSYGYRIENAYKKIVHATGER